MKLLTAFLFASTLFVTMNGKAAGSFYIEPGINYGLTKTWKVDFPADVLAGLEEDDYQGSMNGLEVNLRGGYNINPIFFIGLDLNYSMASLKSKTSIEARGSSTAYGLNFGGNIPSVKGLKLWGTYYFGGAGKWEDDSEEFTVNSITAIKLGVGYQIGSTLSLNLEYMLNGIMKDTDSYDTKVSGLSVGLSFPYEF
jgi:hypothetical protein